MSVGIATRGALVGTAGLVGAILRRERIRIALWIGGLVLLTATSAAGTEGLFPTQDDLDAAAAASDNPAIRAFNGPAQALDTLGGQIAFQIGAPGLAFVALMSLLMVGRLTRGEEEAGRLELIRSLPVGRHAPLAAATLVVSAMSLAVGALVTIAFLAIGLEAPGSVSFGLAFVMVGLVFAAVTLAVAQVSDSTRTVYGLAGTVLAVSYLLRAVGDMNDGSLSWLSPIGWVQKARPWADERWWPFLLPLAAVVLLLAAAAAMAARRDLGAGLVAPAPGRPEARPSLSGPLPLAVRLQRGSLIGWSVGVAFFGLAYGSITNSIEEFVIDNPTMADLFTAADGGTLVESYLATSIRITALLGAGFAVQSMLRLRAEETALRAEPLLAAAVSRWRWVGAHLAVAIGGSVVVLVVLGLSIGVSAALTTGDGELVGQALTASLAYAPATWFLVAVVTLLTGLRPRLAPVGWAVLAFGFVLAMFGALLDLPGWIADLSPFEHVPLAPAANLVATPLVVLTALATGLAAVGVVGLRHRDIG